MKDLGCSIQAQLEFKEQCACASFQSPHQGDCVLLFSHMALFSRLPTKRLCGAKLSVKIAFCRKANSIRQLSQLVARKTRKRLMKQQALQSRDMVALSILALFPGIKILTGAWQEKTQHECFERAQITSWNVVGYPPNFCVLPTFCLVESMVYNRVYKFCYLPHGYCLVHKGR